MAEEETTEATQAQILQMEREIREKLFQLGQYLLNAKNCVLQNAGLKFENYQKVLQSSEYSLCHQSANGAQNN